jgi:hypothetical protein
MYVQYNNSDVLFITLCMAPVLYCLGLVWPLTMCQTICVPTSSAKSDFPSHESRYVQEIGLSLHV